MAGYLLDTNIISEMARADREPRVMKVIRNLDNAYLSVLTVHEIAFGIELLPVESERRQRLTRKMEEILEAFEERILMIGQSEARLAGAMRASARKMGQTVHAIDSLIAATALVEGLTVVTRNEKDFSNLEVAVLNPWTD